METTGLSYFRLDSSSYHRADFFIKEEKMFNSQGVSRGKDPFESQILISNTHTDFNKLPLERLNQTKLLLHPNSGYDNIPAAFVHKAPFPIITGNSIRAHAVTEYILGALFHHFSSLPLSEKWDTSRTWDRLRLADQSVFILGYGHIGKLLEQSLKPLVKKIIIHDPYQGLDHKNPEGSDVVLLASSLNKTSKGIIDKAFLSRLAPRWVLINGARGALIKEADLISSLKEDPSSSAYLDVFEKEPLDFSQFSSINNLHTSSHIAGVSENLDELILAFERDCTENFLTHRSNRGSFETYFKELLLKNKLSTDISFLV
jgi:D-3-phosphoglycerate dehydrogenase